MKKVLLSTLLMLTLGTAILAQGIENNLIEWNKKNPIEKVYLHTDRESYFAGQTLWFKGYFMNGLVPSAKSSTLHIELINTHYQIIAKGAYPAYMGSTIGQLTLPDNLPAGIYQLRAFSPVMLNQPGFTFNKRITVFGKETKTKASPATVGKNEFTFFPEGGNLITGLLNMVAFKAVDKNGMPLPVEGEIRSDKGELVTSFNSVHDGMGAFPIIPQQGTQYTATIKGSGEVYTLPAATASGIVLSIRGTARGKQFKIMQAGSDNTFRPAYMIGQMDNDIIFKQPLNAEKSEINGLIPIESLYSGILQITVFNKDNMPLAERITFVDNKEYMLHASLQTDTLDMASRKYNRFTIAMPDTIIGNFSVSVTDADYESEATRPQNIYSYFLLNSNLRGYIHNPSYYFSAEAGPAKEALDLVMLTNGWTRFKWTDVAQNKLPTPIYTDKGFINLSGRIFIEGTKKPLVDKDVIMMMSPVDTVNGKRSPPQFIKTDSAGSFQLDSQIFYDKYKILFSDIRGNKSKYIQVKLNADSLHRKYNLEVPSLPLKDSNSAAYNSKMLTAFNEFASAEGLTLETVTVKGRQKTESEKLDELYASGLFSGGINNRTFDLRNEIFGGDIFQYLQGRVPGLTVTGSPGSYTLNYRGGGLGGSNVALFLDEMPVDATMIESIPVAEIALLKLMPNSVVTPGAGTALAIYRKKGADLTAALESPTDIIFYNGYTIYKEFYSPDYSKQPEQGKADNRLTLQWMPGVFVSEVNPKIPVSFFNNDRTKRFKLVAEGVTQDGRLMMIEKIIEPGTN